MADDLPPGFTVDRADELPPGFTVDPPRAPTITDRLQSARDTLDASTRGIVEGIPIVGPLLNRGAMAAAALPSAAIPGMSVAGSYEKLKQEGERTAAEHPIASAVGNVTGGVVSTVPVARAFPAVFGGATMPGQIAAGGVIGGTDAAVRSGGDPNAIALGAGIGAAGPVMGSVLAPVGQGLVSAGRAVRELPGVRSAMGSRVVPMAGEDILKAGERGYQSLGGMAKYDPAAIDDLTRLIKSDIYSGSKGTPTSAAATYKVLDDIGNLPPNPASLHNTRKQLQEVINTAGAGSAEGQSALHARTMIDHFLEAPPPNAVIAAPGFQRDFDERRVCECFEDRVATDRLLPTGIAGMCLLLNKSFFVPDEHVAPRPFRWIGCAIHECPIDAPRLATLELLFQSPLRGGVLRKEDKT